MMGWNNVLKPSAVISFWRTTSLCKVTHVLYLDFADKTSQEHNWTSKNYSGNVISVSPWRNREKTDEDIGVIIMTSTPPIREPYVPSFSVSFKYEEKHIIGDSGTYRFQEPLENIDLSVTITVKVWVMDCDGCDECQKITGQLSKSK